MNAISTPSQDIAAAPALRNNEIQRFETAMKYADTFANASLLPEHIRGRKENGKFVEFSPEEIRANCFLICNQAMLWEIDPFSAISESYVVHGKLAFQGKLVAAVVNRELKKKLKPSYVGTGDDRQCTITGTLKDEDEPRDVVVRLGSVKTDNQMWRKDPDQKLFYTAAVKWARRHLPEVLLGISSDGDDELQVIDVRPTPRPAITRGSDTKNASEEAVNRYVRAISDAKTEAELEQLVSDFKGEPTELINDHTVERLTNLAKTKWGLLSRERRKAEYESQISQTNSKDDLANLADVIYADEKLSLEVRKELGELINEKANGLDGAE